MNTLLRTCLLALLGLFLASMCYAADWPNWRGPNCTAVQPDGPKLMDAWKKGPATVWTSEPLASGDGGGYGSPVVANGKVYQYINWNNYPGANKAMDVIVCLNAKDGTTLWKTTFPGRNPGRGSAGTPAVANGKVFADGGNGFYCLDADTGKELWSVPCLNTGGGDGGGAASSPTVIGDVVVVGCPIRGFDVATGKQLWQCTASGGNVYSSPVQWKAGDKTYVIADLDKLVCIDPTDGTPVWTVAQGAGNSTPTINGDYVVLSNDVAVFKLTPQAGTKVFTVGLGDRGASQFIYQDHVYAYDGGTVRCLDFTGKKLWEQNVGGEIASVVAAGGEGFVISGDGTLNMWALTPDAKPTFYKSKIPVCTYTTPAIVDGKLYSRLRGGKGVGCFDLTSEPVPVPGQIDRTTWVCTAISGANPGNVVSDTGERWSSEHAMKVGDWLQIDMLKTYKLKQVTLDSSPQPSDAAQGVQLWLSTDGTNFTKAAEYTADQTKAMGGLVKFDLVPSVEARYIKFVNMGASGSWWSVYNVGTTFDTPVTTPVATPAATPAA